MGAVPITIFRCNSCCGTDDDEDDEDDVTRKQRRRRGSDPSPIDYGLEPTGATYQNRRPRSNPGTPRSAAGARSPTTGTPPRRLSGQNDPIDPEEMVARVSVIQEEVDPDTRERIIAEEIFNTALRSIQEKYKTLGRISGPTISEIFEDRYIADNFIREGLRLKLAGKIISTAEVSFRLDPNQGPVLTGFSDDFSTIIGFEHPQDLRDAHPLGWTRYIHPDCAWIAISRWYAFVNLRTTIYLRRLRFQVSDGRTNHCIFLAILDKPVSSFAQQLLKGTLFRVNELTWNELADIPCRE